MSGMLLLFDINLIEVTAFNFLDGTLGEKRNLLALYSASFSFFLSFFVADTNYSMYEFAKFMV